MSDARKLNLDDLKPYIDRPFLVLPAQIKTNIYWSSYDKPVLRKINGNWFARIVRPRAFDGAKQRQRCTGNNLAALEWCWHQNEGGQL